jgi:DNA invertase Pin-like site-specific DNA recombinase
MTTIASDAPRVALYARTSTTDGRQQHANQLGELRDYAARMGWLIVSQYLDAASGAKDNRPELEKMMHAAARRAFDIVAVWDLSRLTRGGPAKAFAIIERLNASGVQFWSMTEEHFRTTGPAGQLLIAIAAYIAKAERESIRGRINAGVARARRDGKRLGRPPVVINHDRVREYHKQGKSTRWIAAKLKTSKSTIERSLARPSK